MKIRHSNPAFKGFISRHAKAFFILLTSLFFIFQFVACGGESSPEGTSAENTGGFSDTPGDESSVFKVSSSTPFDTTNAYRDTYITVRFSKNAKKNTLTINTDTACSGTFQLSDSSSFTSCIPMNSEIDGSGVQYKFRSASQLPASKKLYYKLTTAIKDTNDTSLENEYTASFTTGANVSPIENEFGTDCSSGSDTIADTKTAIPSSSTDANLSSAKTISGLVVTGMDRNDSFYVQKGAQALLVDVSTSATACGGSGCSGNKAGHYKLKIGDEICLTVSRGKTRYSIKTVTDFTAIKKTGFQSVTPFDVNTSGLPTQNDISRKVVANGTLTTKSTGTGYYRTHVLTAGGHNIQVSEQKDSTKFNSINQGDTISISSVIGWFSSNPQIKIDANLGSVNASSSGGGSTLQVSSSSPANSATSQPTALSASITFNKSMNVASVNTAFSVKQTNCSGAVVSTGTPTTSNSDKTFTYSLSGLSTNTTYATCVSTTAKDTNGSPLASQYEATWTTGTGVSSCTDIASLRSSITGSNITVNCTLTDVYVTYVHSNGFNIQKTQAGEAIFVYTGSAPTVTVGNKVTMSVTKGTIYSQLKQIPNTGFTISSNDNGNYDVAANLATTINDGDTINDSLESRLIKTTQTGKITALGTHQHTFRLNSGSNDYSIRKEMGSTDFACTGREFTVTKGVIDRYNTTFRIRAKSADVNLTNSCAFELSSASVVSNTTVTLTFSDDPKASTANVASNYKIVGSAANCTDASALSVSAASYTSGKTVSLTTATQTSGTNYKVCVSNVQRNSDSATLTSNHTTFTGAGTETVIYSQDFESCSKSGYAKANTTGCSGSIQWELEDALIGTLSNDKKNGSRSVRIRKTTGVATMTDNVAGAKRIKFQYAKYGTSPNSKIQLKSSTDNGATWVNEGPEITVNNGSFLEANISVNHSSPVRFCIKKTSGTATSNRVNIDDFQILN